MSWIDDEEERGKDPAVMDAYEALLRLRLERDGEATPLLAECPAAHRLVERGEAVWTTCLTLGLPDDTEETGKP